MNATKAHMTISSREVKLAAKKFGADECGIAGVERFAGAPEGFKPTDIFGKCRSVVVFLKKMPPEVLSLDNPVPYTRTANQLWEELDAIALKLSLFLEDRGVPAVPVPSDDPYLYWNEKNKRGMGIMSMRHAGMLAGLGVLGRNTLLVNKDYGNLVYIGCVLAGKALKADPVVKEAICPPKCRVCIKSCHVKALDGITVNQKLCRGNSIKQTARGFTIYTCNLCRRACPRREGVGK